MWVIFNPIVGYGGFVKTVVQVVRESIRLNKKILDGGAG